MRNNKSDKSALNKGSPLRKKQSPRPNVVCMDDIAMMLDDDLLEHIRQMETERDKALDAGDNPIFWEVESCYARREFQIRRGRHGLHDQYLQQMDRELREMQRLEDRYPVADLDNSAFIALARYSRRLNEEGPA